MPREVGEGSSPPVRGARRNESLSSHCAGLIPARAGSTESISAMNKHIGAHPRPCGEHDFIIIINRWEGGSSPPVRGAPGTNHELLSGEGLIPARAGSTRSRIWTLWVRRAHPRPCGEHALKAGAVNQMSGSSPPVRGALIIYCLPPLLFGLIPARAGSTLADMGFYPLYRQNRITLEPEPPSRIHDKQLLLTPTSTAIPTRLTPPRLRYNFTNHRTINQLNTLKIDRLPIRIIYPKLKPLLIIRRKHHSRTTSATRLQHTRPQLLTNPSAYTPHKHPRINLQKPLRQITTKTHRTSRQNNNNHQSAPPSP